MALNHRIYMKSHLSMHNLSRRVVVTGMGIIAPGAIGKDQLWNLLVHGRPAIAALTRFDPRALPCTVAGEVNGFDPLNFMDRKTSHRVDRSTQLALGATRLACEDADWNPALENKSRVGVFEGTSLGPLVSTLESHRNYLQSGCRLVNPTLLMSSMMGGGSGFIALQYGVHGPSLTISDGSVSSAYAIGYAYRSIRSGEVGIAIAGGAEAPLAEEIFATFGCAHLLSSHNEAPGDAMKPFDQHRDGFVLGEGAAFLILEELEHATSRNASSYGEIVGFGETTDAHHPTSPNPDGTWASQAMENALSEGNTLPGEVQYVNAHGTATRTNDEVEMKMLRSVFGHQARQLSISSTKPFTGHLLGACGALEAATTLLAMQHGFVPPTLNLLCPDVECDMDLVPCSGREKHIDIAMSNNYSFGGRNSSLLFRHIANHKPLTGTSS